MPFSRIVHGMRAISLSNASRSRLTTKARGALPPGLTPALVDDPKARAISRICLRRVISARAGARGHFDGTVAGCRRCADGQICLYELTSQDQQTCDLSSARADRLVRHSASTDCRIWLPTTWLCEAGQRPGGLHQYIARHGGSGRLSALLDDHHD